MTENDQLMSLRDIERYIKVSRRTLATWRASGKLPDPDFAMGKTLRWKRQTIDQWSSNSGKAN